MVWDGIEEKEMGWRRRWDAVGWDGEGHGLLWGRRSPSTPRSPGLNTPSPSFAHCRDIFTFRLNYGGFGLHPSKTAGEPK